MARQNRKQQAESQPQVVNEEELDSAEWEEIDVELIAGLDADTALAIGLDETVPQDADSDDDLTPENLLGDHRESRWASREDEADLGLDPLPED